MKSAYTVVCAGMLVCFSCVISTVAVAQSTGDQERMAWWKEARFGMFIHWGVYSVPAGTYEGKRIGGIGEWIMHHGKIPVATYREYAKQFNPVKYDPEAWVKMAKDAGMKYIVITSKHHDGFALFETKASKWNVVDAAPYGKDLLKPLAEACQKHGMKLGFYYSQAQDWNNPGGAAAGGHWDPAQDGSMDEYIRNVAVPQVKEILSNYGPIAILWWDTPVDMTKERADMLRPLVALQPGIITNNRLGGGYPGDTDTPEQYIPPTGIPGRNWEVCMTMNDTWGYKSYDDHWKSTEMLVRNLIDIASKGGNYLLNVGPTSEGLIPDASIQRLKEIGAWMKANSESIYGTNASPFRKLAWGRCTQKTIPEGTRLYLHVFEWPEKGELFVPGLKNEVLKAYLLGDSAAMACTVKKDEDGVIISVPGKAPDTLSTTVVLDVKGTPEVEQFSVQASDGSIEFGAADATLHGTQIKTEIQHKNIFISSWADPKETAEWLFKVSKKGKYTVSAVVASEEGASFQVVIGNKVLNAVVPKTKKSDKFNTIDLGVIKLNTKGKATLVIKPVAEGWHPVTLKAILLKPKS